jgi:hypothetical protein
VLKRYIPEGIKLEDTDYPVANDNDFDSEDS